MNLLEYIRPQDANLPQLITRHVGKPIKDAGIALAFVDPALLGGWGSSFTPTNPNTPIVLTGANIMDAIYDLAVIRSQCYFFPNPSVSIKRPKATAKKYNQKFGTQEIEQETGERVERWEVFFRDYLRNQEWFNAVIDAAPGMDILVFTNTTAVWIRADQNSPVIHDADYELGGNADNTAGPGTFMITCYNENGNLLHYEGVKLAQLSAEKFKFTFGAATNLVGTITEETASNGRRRYKRTGSAAICGFTRAVAQAGAQYVTYTLKPISDNAVTNIASATINPTTGALSFAQAIPVGTYEFQVVASNEVGIFGTYSFTLVIT